MVNEVFSQVLFVQFFASILILWTSVYYLSSHITVADFVKLVIYTFCMFVQIFVYCWAGNKVILKVNHNFFLHKKKCIQRQKKEQCYSRKNNLIILIVSNRAEHWIKRRGIRNKLVTISEQKDLLMIMKRSTRPIKFTSSFLVTLSLDSYANISTTMDIFFDTA